MNTWKLLIGLRQHVSSIFPTNLLASLLTCKVASQSHRKRGVNVGHVLV